MRAIINLVWPWIWMVSFAVACPGMQSASDRTAAVTVSLISIEGLPLPPGRLIVEDNRGQTISSVAIADKVELNLPFGVYEFRVRGNFFNPANRTVEIKSQRLLVVMGTTFMSDYLPASSTSISIAVHPPGSCIVSGRLLARLFSIYGGYSTEREITSLGYALFEPIEPGIYMVVVADGPNVRAMQIIKTTEGLVNQSLALNDCPKRSK